MQKNISDVIKFFEDRPMPFPENIHVRKCALSPRLPLLGLPRSYIEFVERIFVENVHIGNVRLGPHTGSLSDYLIHVNEDDIKNPCIDSDFVAVATTEGDWIVVPKGSQGHNDGRVFYVDISTGFFPGPQHIADTFESFVITTSNLYEYILHEDEWDQSQFFQIASELNPGVDASGIRCWQDLFFC